MESAAMGSVGEALLSAVPGSVYVVSADGEVLDVPDAPEATGFEAGDPDALPGASLSSVLPSAVTERLGEAVAETAATGEERTLEYEGPEDGGRRYEARSIPIEGTDRVLLAIEDAGPADLPDPDLLARAFEQAPIGITISGPRSEDLRLEYVNEAFTEMTGYEPSEALGRNCRYLQGERTEDERVKRIRESIEAEESVTVELRNYRADGTEFWNRLTVAPIGEESAEDRNYVGFQEDVTREKLREAQLSERRRRIEMALDGTGTAVWEWNPVDDEMTWTGSMDRLFGIEDDKLDATFGGFLGRIHPEDRDDLTMAATTVEAGETFETECRIDRGDGETIWAEVRGRVVGGEDATDYVVGTVTDVTERKERERKLEESNERLEQFAYVASHDLQEPLRTVSNYVEILAEEYGDELGEDGREFVDVATTGCSRMQSMINGLLDYSRVTTRGRDFEPVDSNEVVADIVDDLEVMLEERDGEVTWSDLPTVDADPDQFRQLFQNLVKNALEHSGEDPVTVRIRASDAGDAYHFEVEDDGPGIDPERQDDVFVMFNSGKQYQTSDQAKGIGLAICENIVGRHGGDIWVESEPGEGTTFHFTVEK